MSILKPIRAWFAGLFSKESSMNLTASQTALAVGATIQLVASEPSTYSLSAGGVVSVDSTGLLTGIAVGSVTVTATSVADASQTATLDFSVVAATVVEPVPVATPVAPAAQAVPAPTELQKLEELIEKLGLTTVKEVKAAISFIRALV